VAGKCLKRGRRHPRRLRLLGRRQKGLSRGRAGRASGGARVRDARKREAGLFEARRRRWGSGGGIQARGLVAHIAGARARRRDRIHTETTHTRQTCLRSELEEAPSTHAHKHARTHTRTCIHAHMHSHTRQSGGEREGGQQAQGRGGRAKGVEERARRARGEGRMTPLTCPLKLLLLANKASRPPPSPPPLLCQARVRLHRNLALSTTGSIK